ncbi:MAG: hypothetical protein K0V04_34625 [Deltaproteobacteria bacterium]|nr:hypothetical protein [Deltaproteobacteria bacterium]
MPTSTSGTGDCVPGQTQTCPCEQGADGSQVCLPDGSGYGTCECESPDDDGTTTTGSDGSTAADTTSTSGTDTDTDTDDSTTGEPAVCDAYMGFPEDECDLWLQDCPAGEKCVGWDDGTGQSPLWNAARCLPIDPTSGQLGDPCMSEDYPLSGIDSCDVGLFCFLFEGQDNEVGRCIELCGNCPADPTCPDSTCTSFTPYQSLCFPGCDPLLQDCDQGGCRPAGDEFQCQGDFSGAGGAPGVPCISSSYCDPGGVCGFPETVSPDCDPTAPGCCTDLCDLTDPAGDAQCTLVGQTCQPFYTEGTAPKEYENVGICLQ